MGKTTGQESSSSPAVKPKLALYWAASCGGCEIAVLDIEEKILDVVGAFDVVFWPVAVDFKVKDVEAMPSKSIDLCLFNGAIRTSENEKMAKLLRDRAKILVAFGSCACEGCIPALSNTTTRKATLDFVYQGSPSTENPNKIRPQQLTKVNGHEIELPDFYETVMSLDQVVPVDYYVPGCPPQADRIWEVLQAAIGIIIEGKPAPPAGTVLGVGEKTCCAECPRNREEKRITSFKRIIEIIPDPEQCLLDQGILCMGPATRDGCGAKCVSVGMACRGCYGPPEGTRDQAAKMISALGAVIDAKDPEEITRIVEQIVDPVGTLYRFSMAHATLGRCLRNGEQERAS
jgi:F420-non-reducing hydrogenase small subunit